MSSKSTDQLHLVMFPFFAFGHVNPFVRLSNKLCSHGVQITFLSAPSNISRIKSSLNPHPSIQIIPLKFPTECLPNGVASTADLPPEMFGNLFKALDLMQHQIKTLLLELNPHFVVFDFAQNWIPKLASEIGIKSVHFSTFPPSSEAYLTVRSRLDGIEGRIITFEDLMKPPSGFPEEYNPCLIEFEARELMHLFQRFDEGPTGYERVMQSLSECSMILFRTFHEIERPYVDYMEAQFKKPILVAGPLVPEPSMGKLEEKWSKWLDRFPAKSVILSAFGSEGYLCDDLIRELAIGLELTELPFILVLNFPVNVNVQDELDKVLPKGFLERVKDRGVVHVGWLQQPLIVAHSSVGCHLTHCGISSLIESSFNDCQLVLLPFRADQFFNFRVVGRDLKAGIEVKRRDEDGYFTREDILEAVKTVMVDVDKEPGKQIRENHKRFREYLLNEETQDSYISDFVAKLKSLA